ncbi:LLM class flavin-dependent oxidoreductase [Myceligenerans pegani]|uniref:LLM class flavin-dependent oxidoreductase n=1 Tax=Myceligenerans pegani TaxID=2776917 RepID=A0ABR9N3Z2_9MICO|nr:LLM class flavin-dependent oxidoreductase [Myceligenerans sp. TRM 65318]MBE1878384.1 LLM class flavin-dependent oxidoreductase [Myceligenerans sp. TRM 65318]MBE3020655.1 LLM class flavin-dependent oxidoreductase [Myceligenerans sp. TRM 65318]
MTSRPRIGVVLPRDLPPSQIVPYAKTAERLGFDELWVVEDLGFRGGLVQAAAVLGATERLRVGVGILPAAVRNPVFAAMEIATLEQLHPGRTDVGIGHGMPGWMRQAGCWPDRPLTFLTEYVTTIRDLLSGAESGGLRLEPSAVPDVVPPLLLGVRGPRSLAASGRVADGTVLAEPVAPEYVAAALDAIAPRGEHHLVAYNIGAVDDDEQAALRTARPGLAWIGEPDWAPHVTPLDIADEFAALRAASATREEFAERLPGDWVARLALAGTPAQVRERIDALGRAGVTSSVFVPAGPDPLAALTGLARVL